MANLSAERTTVSADPNRGWGFPILIPFPIFPRGLKMGQIEQSVSAISVWQMVPRDGDVWSAPPSNSGESKDRLGCRRPERPTFRPLIAAKDALFPTPIAGFFHGV